MNQHALLQAIRDDPADDLVRLAYADWLEEQGNAPRAEMIRLQIELTRGVADRASELPLLRRLRELVVAHRAAWLGPLLEIAPDTVFERGFVARLRLSPRALVRDAGTALDPHPITWLELEGDRDAVGKLAACSGLSGVRVLRHRDSALTDREAEALAGSPHLGRLRVLHLDGNRVTAAGLTALVGASWPLEELSLRSNALGNALGPFVHSAGLPTLRRLDLSGNRVGARGAELLAGPSWLAGLTTLSLSYNNLETADVQRLAESPHLAGVESLGLYQSGMPAETARHLRERYGARVRV